MRDIPNANSANISYVQPVNSKVSSGTLTKADYKSYRDFLGNYNTKKCSKDDQESVSSTDSGIFPYKLADSKSNNTSSSSLNSEANGSTSKNNPEPNASFNNRMGSFRNYLDTYNNKKFSTVKLQVPQKTNTVKSEITIQVNDPLENTNKDNEIFQIVLDSSSGDIIEKPSSISVIKSVSTSLPPPPPMPPILSPRNEISSHHNNTSAPTTPPPPPPLPSPSGSLNGTKKKWSTINAVGNNSTAIKKEPNHAAANLAKVLQEHFVLRNIKSDRFEKDPTETSKNALPPPVPKSPTSVTNKKPKLTSLNVNLGSNCGTETKKENVLQNSKPPIHSSTNVFKTSQKFQQKPSTDGRQFPNKPLIKTQSFNGTFNTYMPKRSNSDAFLPNNESTDRCDGIEFHTRTVIPVVDNTKNVSKSDPNVKKLVYNTYRGLLSAYNNKANDMIATLPRKMVREDRGISRQLESMALQGGLDKLNGRTNPKIDQEQAAAPPPPPVGHIPSTRLKSEISDRKTEPPLCVQNAMLTKDKKPFTYTPGGIDLSEIRSPRMAKRLERNAMSEGVTPSVHPQNHHPPTNLPPSALAAMQPQLSVQVFPSGKIPQLHHHGGAPPPPPPPPNNIPPPPRAPPLNLGAPLPKDNFDRPDMTKIIPENPLKLLRKTSGPVIKQDPIFRRDNYNNSHQNVNLNNTPSNTERIEPKPVTPNTSSSGVGSIYIPPLNQNSTPPAMYKQPQSPQLIRQSENSPDVRSPPPYYKRQPSSPHAEAQSPTLVQRQPSLNASSRDTHTPESPKPSLSKAPTPWLTQPRQQPEVPKWATNEQSRITPPTQEYQFPTKQEEPVQYRNPYPNPNQTQSSPWPNEPQTWQPKPPDQQKQYYQQEQQQPWRQKQPEQQPWQQPSHMNQSPPIQVSQKGVQKQVQNREHIPRSEPTERVEVVIVNEPPIVFQHPGQHQQRNVIRQQPPQQNNYPPQYQNQNSTQGVRIIPIQVEGQDSNGHDRYNNSDGRSFNRQQSWNSNPTQSGSFKVLQKITQTDGEEDDNQIITEHSPKSQHQFPQRQMSTEQPRRFRENGNNNNFIQGPPNQQNMARGPQVRTIPIQIESDGPGRVYVPPSEQIVQEPKKYMGSSIPSRSFKMLQAMTGPEECAKTNQDCENNEIYSNDPSSYSEWGFNPNYPQPQPQPAPYYFDPYWGYYPPYPPSKNEPILNNSSHRTTPIPFGWRYTPPNYPTIEHSNCDTNGSKSSNLNNLYNETESTKGHNIKHRATPVPHSMHYYPNYQYENKNLNVPQLKEQSNNDQAYPQCPQYWDPYYYYYGMPPPPPPMYPPIYSPYPFYPPQQSDAEEISGYSSTDEMSYYGARFANMPPFNNPKQKPLVESHLVNTNKNQKEKIEDNRHIKQEFVKKTNKFDNKIEDDSSVTETSDSDSEMTGYEVCRGPIGLQAIRSVSNIKVYEEDGSSCCSEDEREDEEEDEDNNSEDNDTLSVHTNDDAIPHQLSVIYEESERADSDMRHVREASVASTISEDTRTVENSENEDDFEDPVIVKLPLTLNFTVDNSQKVAMITVGNSEVLNSSACDINCNGMKAFADNVEINSDSNDLYFDENSKIQDTNQVGDITDCDDNESEVDWWGQIERTDSTAYFKRKLNNQQSEWEKEMKNNNEEEQLGTVYESVDQTVETQNDDSQNGVYSLTNLEIPEFNLTEAYRCHDIEANRCYDIETNHCQYGEANTFHSDNDNTNNININEHLDDTASIKTNKSDEVDFWAEITSSDDNVRKIAVNKENSVCSSDSSSNSSEILHIDAYQPNPLNGVENPKQSFYNETENNVHSIQSKSFTCAEEEAKEDYQMPSIQDRIKALQAIIALKHAQREDQMEIKNLAKDRIAVVDDTNEMLSIERNISKRRSNSRKSSVKSYDDYSEEDGDSGVTSDVSKHISEIDTESECMESRKHYQYQRANTHSRLFKLLQGEEGDENEDDEISMEINEDYQKENMQCRRNHLNLPLNKITNSDPESFSSSGFTSPGSPIINEKLVGELILSLLQNKNSTVLKNITLEKIQNAAIKILQEDADGLENFNSSEDGGCYLSPRKPDTGNSTAAQTPQEFYTHFNDYNQYYESWADASRLSESQCDILPSKAFRLIQSHAASNRTGSIAGLLARCPRVLSNKNVQKELMKLIEMQNNLSSDPPEQIPDSNEATNAP